MIYIKKYTIVKKRLLVYFWSLDKNTCKKTHAALSRLQLLGKLPFLNNVNFAEKKQSVIL